MGLGGLERRSLHILAHSIHGIGSLTEMRQGFRMASDTLLDLVSGNQRQLTMSMHTAAARKLEQDRPATSNNQRTQESQHTHVPISWSLLYYEQYQNRVVTSQSWCPRQRLRHLRVKWLRVGGGCIELQQMAKVTFES